MTFYPRLIVAIISLHFFFVFVFPVPVFRIDQKITAENGNGTDFAFFGDQKFDTLLKVGDGIHLARIYKQCVMGQV